MLELLLPTLLLTTMLNSDSDKPKKDEFPNFPKSEYKICSLEEYEKLPMENTKKDHNWRWKNNETSSVNKCWNSSEYNCSR